MEGGREEEGGAQRLDDIGVGSGCCFLVRAPPKTVEQRWRRKHLRIKGAKRLEQNMMQNGRRAVASDGGNHMK